MKYTRLTKEQFQELHPEFTKFLASQSIDKQEWDQLKQEKPDVAEQELDVFSDLIWEGVLTRAEYLEHFGKNYIFFFHCGETHIHSIILKSIGNEVDFLSKEGLQYLNENMFTDAIEIQKGTREYDNGERNAAIFDLIRQGAFLSSGDRYKQLIEIIG